MGSLGVACGSQHCRQPLALRLSRGGCSAVSGQHIASNSISRSQLPSAASPAPAQELIAVCRGASRPCCALTCGLRPCSDLKQLIDVGDFVGVTGDIKKTDRGEVSFAALP